MPAPPIIARHSIAPAQSPRAQRCRSAANATTQPAEQLVVRAALVRNPSRGDSIALPAHRLPQAAGGAGGISQYRPNCQACSAARRWQMVSYAAGRALTTICTSAMAGGWEPLVRPWRAMRWGERAPPEARARTRAARDVHTQQTMGDLSLLSRHRSTRGPVLLASTHPMRHRPAAVGTHAWRCRPARRAVAASPVPGRVAPTDHARPRTACTGPDGAAMSAARRPAGRRALSLRPP